MKEHYNPDSILHSVKKIIGLSSEYSPFDNELILHINSVLSILNQLGVGEKGYFIVDEDDEWVDFLGENASNVEDAKTYVGLKVKLIFDPPTTGLDAFRELIKELEWRINVEVDKGDN